MDAPTFEDYVRIARDEILSRSPRITREVIEQTGTEANILVNGMAAVADEVTGQIVRLASGLYLDSAKGKLLDRYVFSRYGLTRVPASQALGTLTLTTTAPAPSTFSIPRGTRFSTADGREFIAWADATFNSGSSGPVYVEVRSVLSGRDQQAAAGTITSLISQLPGSPTDLAVTNAVATAGAGDEESDESLRERARQFFSTARRGTLAAIRAAALSVPGVYRATAFETTDALGRPARSAQLVIADQFTDALVDQAIDPPSYETQSQLLAQQVSTELEEWRAAGVFVLVTVAQTVLQGVTLALRFTAGVNVDQVALAARAQVVGYINSLSPGDDLIPANLIEQLRYVSGLEVTGEEILSPAGTVVVAPLQVVRTTLSLVVASTVQPDVALQGSANPDVV